MRTLICLILAFLAGLLPSSGQRFEDYFHRKTLRYDYIHTGTRDKEQIKSGKLIAEPYWGGSLTNLIDTFGYGRYHFNLKDAITGTLLYSRGFSTLFVEWQDTDEAKTKRKGFKESIVMPFPKEDVLLEIYRRDKKNQLHLIFSDQIRPEKDKIATRAIPSWEKRDIALKGDPAEKLDIVFLAEGYTAAEMNQFWDDCVKFAGYLTGAAPFGESREQINFRGVGVVSAESGVSLPGEKIFRKTGLGAAFYTFGSERYLMAEDFQRVRDAAGLVPYDQIFIIVNSNKYGGGGIFNFYATGARGNKEAAFLLIHEFGHSFAGLGDEYYTSEVAVDAFYDLQTEPWEPNITTLTHFDRKWKDMLLPGTPVPTPAIPANEQTIGVFEGAGYAAKGIYRPFQECTMKSVRYDAFCPVCRRAILQMIRFYCTP